MADSKNPWDAAIETEAALTAYSTSMLYPVIIDCCREIDSDVASEIEKLLDTYRVYMKDLIDEGKVLAESGIDDLSGKEIGDKIDASLAQVREFFADANNRNKRSCEAYKAMIEFDVQLMK